MHIKESILHRHFLLVKFTLHIFSLNTSVILVIIIRASTCLYLLLNNSVTLVIIHRSSSCLTDMQYLVNHIVQLFTSPSAVVCTYYLCMNVDPYSPIIMLVCQLWRTHSRCRWVLMCSRITYSRSTHSWSRKFCVSILFAPFCWFIGIFNNY